MTQRIALAFILMLGCSSDDVSGSGGEETSPTDGESLGDDTAGCEPGSPGCPCANGMCLSPLVCVADECTWPPDPIDTDAGEADTGDGSSGDDGTPPACSSDDDCVDEDTVCLPDGECRHAWYGTYEVHVLTWVPTNCSGGTFDGAADLWWSLRLGEQLIFTSPWTQGGCPGHWESSVACVEGGAFFEPFVLSLYDEDNTASELFDQLWFDYGDGAPGLFPPEHLIAGSYDGTTNNGGNVVIEFDLVDSCD
jgi:hypothetical protein